MLSLLYLGVKAKQYFVCSRCIFLDKKTLLKIWLDPWFSPERGGGGGPPFRGGGPRGGGGGGGPPLYGDVPLDRVWFSSSLPLNRVYNFAQVCPKEGIQFRASLS